MTSIKGVNHWSLNRHHITPGLADLLSYAIWLAQNLQFAVFCAISAV